MKDDARKMFPNADPNATITVADLSAALSAVIEMIGKSTREKGLKPLAEKIVTIFERHATLKTRVAPLEARITQTRNSAGWWKTPENAHRRHLANLESKVSSAKGSSLP